MLLFIIAISQLSITFVDVAAAKNDLKGTIHNLNSKYHPGIVFPEIASELRVTISPFYAVVVSALLSLHLVVLDQTSFELSMQGRAVPDDSRLLRIASAGITSMTSTGGSFKVGDEVL